MAGATPTEIERLLVRLTGDGSDYRRTLDEATKATADSARKMASEAARVSQSVRTPTEVHAQKMAQLNKLYASGLLSHQDYSRAVARTTVELKSHQMAAQRAGLTMKQYEDHTRLLSGGLQLASRRLEVAGVMLRGYGAQAVAMMLPIMGIHKGMRLLTESVSAFADAEQTQVAFKSLTGNADLAKETLKDLTKFAQETPFQLPEVLASAKQMIAFGQDARSIVPAMRTLGDVASALNINLGHLTYVYGTLRAQGRAYTYDINQFATRGIPIWDELAKVLGVTKEQVRGYVEHGRVGFAEVQQAFQNMTKEGGRFHGMMKEQSKTLAGSYSNLKDAMGQIYVQLGRHVSEALRLKEAVAFLTEKVAQFQKWLENLDPQTRNMYIRFAALTVAVVAFAVLWPFVGGLVTRTVGGIGRGLLGLMNPLTYLTKGFGLLGMAGGGFFGSFAGGFGKAAKSAGGLLGAFRMMGPPLFLLTGPLNLVLSLLGGMKSLVMTVLSPVRMLSGAFGIVRAVAGGFVRVLFMAINPLKIITALVGVLGGIVSSILSPIGLVAAAVAGLAALFVIQAGGIEGAWEQIKKAAMDAWDWMQPIIKALKQFWRTVKMFAKQAWDGLKTAAKNAWTWLTGQANIDWGKIQDTIVTAIYACEFVMLNFGRSAKAAWELIKIWADVAWVGVKLIFAKALNFILKYLFVGFLLALPGGPLLLFILLFKDTARNILNFFKEMFEKLGENIEKFMTGLWNAIRTGSTDPLKNFWADLQSQVKITWTGIEVKGLKEWEERLRNEFDEAVRNATAKSGHVLDPLLQDFEKFKAARMAENLGGGDPKKGPGGAANTIADEIGKGAAAINKASHKLDAALVGSAEAFARYEEYRDTIFDPANVIKFLDKQKAATKTGGKAVRDAVASAGRYSAPEYAAGGLFGAGAEAAQAQHDRVMREDRAMQAAEERAQGVLARQGRDWDDVIGRLGGEWDRAVREGQGFQQGGRRATTYGPGGVSVDYSRGDAIVNEQQTTNDLLQQLIETTKAATDPNNVGSTVRFIEAGLK